MLEVLNLLGYFLNEETSNISYIAVYHEVTSVLKAKLQTLKFLLNCGTEFHTEAEAALVNVWAADVALAAFTFFLGVDDGG